MDVMTEEDRFSKYVEYSEKIKRKRSRTGKRKPLNGKNRLRFDAIEDHRIRVFNDKDDRIFEAMDNGWEPVRLAKDTDLGDMKTGDFKQPGTIITKHVGGGVTGVLMKKKNAWDKEDQEAKQKELDKQEKSLYRSNNSPDSQGIYGSIKRDKV